MAGESLELERAYLAARVVTGAPMLVTFEGRLARVNRMDAVGEEDALVVERFERIWPSATCSTRLSLPLVGPRWRLEELDGVANDAEEGAPELAFAENGSVSGSNGCNRINGTYTRHDDALTFGAIGGTRRACVEPTRAALEKRFGAMLDEVDGLRLERTRLEMMRGADVVSRFVAAE
jgi:heat shock protein HslJ